MKYTIYLICFLSFMVFEIGYRGTMRPFLQAQEPTPSTTSADNSKEEKSETIPIAVIISLGLEPYTYQHDPRNRDPFVSLRRQETQNITKDVVKQTVLGPNLPLERFDVDEFQLMGVIWDTDQPRALIMDPDKQSHIVKKNDRIGLYKGHLAEIREGEIIIAEPKQQGLKIQYNIKTLSIKKKQEKNQKNKK